MSNSFFFHFAKYTSFGVINTAIHWAIFLGLYYTVTAQQIICNTLAFLAAVSFSFYANSKWTFNAPRSLARYSLYVFLMGLLAAGIGKLSDVIFLPPLLTLVISSCASLIVGFIISRSILTAKNSQ
ncbi:GtrA family protein [Pseudomonas nicosulfuronedens]